MGHWGTWDLSRGETLTMLNLQKIVTAVLNRIMDCFERLNIPDFEMV